MIKVGDCYKYYEALDRCQYQHQTRSFYFDWLLSQFPELDEKDCHFLLNRWMKGGTEVMGEICRDNRFETIKKAKKHLIEATNIETSPDEMKVLDNFLYRCWQMGWLKEYEEEES